MLGGVRVVPPQAFPWPAIDGRRDVRSSICAYGFLAIKLKDAERRRRRVRPPGLRDHSPVPRGNSRRSVPERIHPRLASIESPARVEGDRSMKSRASAPGPEASGERRREKYPAGNRSALLEGK